jgi:ABC-type polysaccharide/polyol phosphate transport system ATPase subunit
MQSHTSISAYAAAGERTCVNPQREMLPRKAVTRPRLRSSTMIGTENAVDVAGVSKRFRFHSMRGATTLKDVVVRRVRKEGDYTVVDALDDVTFSLPHGQTLGIIGTNGSGKTTLLRILAGVTKPDRGEVRMRGSVATLLALGAGFNTYLTGRENAMLELLTLGLSRSEAKSRMNDVIAFSELEEFIDAPLRTYSSGMGMRLAFAAAICVDPDILLIDEVLAVGDERFAKKCATWMQGFKQRGKTVVLVTHSSSTVTSDCDAALWLDNGRVRAFSDPVTVVRSYLKAEDGGPVAETAMIAPPQTVESATAMAEMYRSRLVNMLPTLRLPLVGFVRQSGTLKGIYEDGWTSGEFQFAFQPLRHVTGCTIHATMAAGMPSDSVFTVEVDDTPIVRFTGSAGDLTARCEMSVPEHKVATMRIRSSTTVNHEKMGLSGDVRDLALRVDEVVFDHDS